MFDEHKQCTKIFNQQINCEIICGERFGKEFLPMPITITILLIKKKQHQIKVLLSNV